MPEPEERYYFYRTQMDIPRVDGEALRSIIQLCWRKLLVLDDGRIVEINETGIEDINLANHPDAKLLIEQITPILIQAAETQISERLNAIENIEL